VGEAPRDKNGGGDSRNTEDSGRGGGKTGERRLERRKKIPRTWKEKRSPIFGSQKLGWEIKTALG